MQLTSLKRLASTLKPGFVRINLKSNHPNELKTVYPFFYR